MQKSYLLAEVSRMRCKEAAEEQATNANLCKESQRICQISQSLRLKKSETKDIQPNAAKKPSSPSRRARSAKPALCKRKLT